MTPVQPQTGPSGSSSLGKSQVELVLIPTREVYRAAPICLKHLLAVIPYARGRMQISDVLQACYTGKSQLWMVSTEEGEVLAAAVTEIVAYPRRRVCSLFLLGGCEMDRWTYLIDELEAWAKEQGCHVLEIQGRKGWGRVFPDYLETHRVFEKELQHG